MYDWVTHMHSHLGGKCPHECSYCYVQKNRFGVSERYQGDVRFLDNELKVNYGVGNTIFIEHMNDMFAKEIKDEWIMKILEHCNKYRNQYVFQTKNPMRANKFIDLFPKKYLFGTTIETNRDVDVSKAPKPIDRYNGMMSYKHKTDTFITLEPILDFDVDILSKWIIDIKPLFINIGADSKKCGLKEPSADKIKELVNILQKNDIVIKKKVNLERIYENTSD